VSRFDPYGDRYSAPSPAPEPTGISAWGTGKKVAVGVVAFIALIFLFGFLIGGCKSMDRTDPSEVAVVYNGGPFDSKDFRETVAPSSSFKVPGLFSQWRNYIPSSIQRYYTITSDPDRADNPSATYVEVPTKDGVQIKLEASTLFHTAFTGEGASAEDCETAGFDANCGDVLLAQFDEQYGNRKFTESGEKTPHHVWEGTDDEGWSAWLDTIFRPILISTIREEIGKVDCADLVSSCALIQQGSTAAGQPDLAALSEKGENNTATFAEVSAAVEDKLQERLTAAMGHEYLILGSPDGDESSQAIQIEKVVLPADIQSAIDTTQSAFAEVTTEKANLEKAEYQAEAAKLLAKEYNNRPELVYLEAAKALGDSSNATIILGEPGTGLNLGK
jgi:hypothetical protein